MSTDPRFSPQRIVSGGQTGVDRAALDAAMALGIEHGGWCPRGRIAEDGVIPSLYQMMEHESADYAARTEQNVIDSDATLILYERKMSGGTLLTYRLAKKWLRPHLTLRMDREGDIEIARQWLAKTQPLTLNIAGPRESTSPGIQERATQTLLELF